MIFYSAKKLECGQSSRFWIFALLCLFSNDLFTQTKKLELHLTDKSENFLKNKIEFDDNIQDTPSLTATLRQIQLDLQAQGYLAASIDSILLKDSLTYLAHVHIGEAYEWLRLRNGNIEEAWLSKAGFRAQLYRAKPLNVQRVRKLQDALLSEAENNGFPFASTRLDSISIIAHQVDAALMMTKGEYIEIDTIRVDGRIELSKKYLENYLGILPNSPYDKSKILRVPQRIRELPFVKATKPLDVTFYGNRAVINLYLEPKKASRFDFIIGVLPNTVSNGAVETTTFTLTGDLKGEFYNAFGFGEQLLVEVEQLRPLTPRLNLAINYPYILNTPFGADAKLLIFKQDTSFLEVASDLGVQYLLEGGNYIKAFWNNQSSNLLELDTLRIKQRGQLPENLDFQRNAFGLEYQQQKLDYRFNPRKGWSLFLRASAGLKNIETNAQIIELSDSETNFQSLYDSLSLNTFQYTLSSTLTTYLPLSKRSTIKLQNSTQAIFANVPILLNEQFRIGGNKVLRGFDEQSVLATQYSLFTLEPRLLIGTNSYFYAFADYALIRDVTAERDLINNAFGFGAGLTLETGVGVFGISLALGQRSNAPLNLRNPKIHFGYVSLF